MINGALWDSGGLVPNKKIWWSTFSTATIASGKKLMQLEAEERPKPQGFSEQLMSGLPETPETSGNDADDGAVDDRVPFLIKL